jgi:hypothetical protein
MSDQEFFPLPPMMASRIAATDAADARQAVVDEAEAADERWHRARMAEVAEHAHQAATGYTSAELRESQQRVIDAHDAAGFDPAAPVGSRQHPELLLDGGSLTPTPHGAARRSSVLEPYLEDGPRPSTAAALLARSAAESAAMRPLLIDHYERELRRVGTSTRPSSTIPAPLPSADYTGALPVVSVATGGLAPAGRVLGLDRDLPMGSTRLAPQVADY